MGLFVIVFVPDVFVLRFEAAVWMLCEVASELDNEFV